MMKKEKRYKMIKRTGQKALWICMVAFLSLTYSKPSLACCSCTDTVEATLNTEVPNHQSWFINTLWADNIMPAMQGMADQLSAVAMHQTAIVGTFFDAKQQMEVQRSLQKIRARAHKDYHPSTGMCEFGSAAKSLAASERKAEVVAHVMSQRFQDRMLGNTNTAAAGGIGYDKPARLNQFKEKFCNPADSDGNLDYLCRHAGGVGATNNQRMNKDIDYTRTVDYPWTLNVDFTDANLTDHEEEVLALADNLYGQEVFKRLSGTDLKPSSTEPFNKTHSSYLDARAVLAKLSVAKNSFDSIVGMKSAGTAGSRDYLEAVLEELGVPNTPQNGHPVDDITRILGYDSNNGNEEIGPSYHAQMEVLTKKIFQNPDFYTNLYDKPANIERKKVAMQAIGLMQKFDLFKSYLRNEASLSVLLELAIVDLQNEIQQLKRDQSSVGEDQ